MVLLLKPLVGVTLLIIYCNATPPPGYVKVPSVDKDPPKYQYGYDIASTDDGTGHGKSESRDGEFAHGKYYVHLPRKGASSRVRYFADDWGYHPVVEYSTNDGHSKVTAQFALGEHAVKALKDGGEVGQFVSKKPTQSTYETIQSVPYSSSLQAGPDSSVNQQQSQILVPYTTNVQHSGPADTSANIQIQPTGNAQSSIIHDPNSSPNTGNVYVDNVNQQQHQPGLNLQGQNNGVATSSQHSIIYTNGEGGDGGNSAQASYNSQVSSGEQPSSQVTYYQNNGGSDGGDGYSGSSQSSGGEQQLVYLQNGDEGGNANQIVEHQQVNQIQHQQQLDDKQNINGAVSNQFITQVLHSQVDGGQNGHENHQQTVSYQSDGSQGGIQQGSNEGLYLQADGHQNTVEIGNNNAYSTQSFSNEISERRKGVQNVFILDGNNQNEIKQQSESYVQDGAALQAYGNQGEQLGQDVSGEQVSEVDLNQSFHQTRINLENAGGYGTKIIHTQTSDSGQNENLFKPTAQSTSVFSTGQGTGQGYNTYAKLVKSTQNLITGKDVLDLNSAVESNQEAVSNVANSVSVTTAKPERLYSKLTGSRKNINIGGFFKDLKSSIHGHLLNHNTHKISEQKFAKPIVVPDFTSSGVSVTTEQPALSITGSIEINSNFNEKSDYFSTTQNTIETEVNKVVHNNPTEPSIIVTPRPVSNNFLAPITAALRLQNSGEKLENIITDCHGEGILKQNAHLGTVVEVQKSVPYYIGQFAYYDNKGALNQISDHHSQQQIVSLNGAYQNDQSVYQQTGVGISENQHFINEQAALTHNAQLIDVSHKEQTVEEVSNTNQNIEIHDQHAELSVQTADIPVHKVEVPVPYPVEKIVEKHVPVPKPYPVEVTKIVEKPVEVIKYVDKPYPVEIQVPVHIPVEVKVPYPVEKHIRVPVEVQKIVEKPIHITKYVDKPYPVHVPQPYPVEVEKIVEKQVPVQVTKYVDKPYPVEVKVPHPVPYPVEKIVEKTKYVDKPYPVKVPYPVHVPVEVKVPVEVTKYVDKPYPVEKIVEKEVRVPVTVEKIVEKPVTKIVEKPYPVHIKVPVPHPVPVEVKVPQPYPVEVKVPQPYAVHVPQPVPVQVTKLVSVPVEVPKYIKQYIERPYPVFVHEHKKHNHEDQSVVQSIQHHTAHILQPVYQQHYGYLGGYGYKDASFQHLSNQAYAVQKQIQQQQSQHQLQQFQQHQHQAQQIQQNQHLTQQIQQSSQQSEHIQQNVKHQSQQVQQSQNYYSYAPSYQILVPKHLSTVHKQPIGHGSVSLQTYALNTKPCDFVGHVQHKGHDFTNLALLKYRRNAHPQPNRSNFGKNLRIEYGFQPPMRPSVETDEQGTPLKKEDN